MNWRLPLLGLLLGLASCGWQLRGQGSGDLDLAALSGVYITASRDNAVAEALRSQLRFRNISLLEQPAPNSLAVILEDAAMQRRVQTVSGDLRARQLRLQLDISFSIYNYQAELLTSEGLQAVRNFAQNPLEPATTDRQQEQLAQEMAAQLAEQLIRLLPQYVFSARENQG